MRLPNLRKFAIQGAASLIERTLPISVRARLSGWGEPRQIAWNAKLREIQSALSTAECGDVYLAWSFYRDMIANSLHVRSEMAKRMIAVVGRPLVIQPANQANEDDKIAADVCNDMVRNCDKWLNGMLHIAIGSMWPVSASEKIYEPVDGADQYLWKRPVRYRLKSLVPVNYALFCYRIAYWAASQAATGTAPVIQGSYYGSPTQDWPTQPTSAPDDSPLYWNPDDWEPDIRFYNVLPNGMIDFSLGNVYKPDPMRHVIHRGNIITSFRDTYGGDLRAVLFWWFLMTLGRDWFADYMLRFGRPFMVGKTNLADKNAVALIRQAFDKSSTVSGGGLVVNRDAEVELVQAAVSGGADGFEKYLRYCQEQITAGVCGHVLATSAKNTGLGSGMADLATDVKDEWRMVDNERLTETVTKQIFTPFLRINGYRGQVKPCWGGLSVSNQVAFTKSLAQLKQAGLKPSDEALQAISDHMGFKVEIDESANLGANDVSNRNSQEPDAN